MRTRLLTEYQTEIAAKIIRNGSLVAIPTETVYGLGGDAFNPTAVAKIFEAKNRPSFDPLIVHIADFEQIYTVAENVPPLAQKLIEKCWAGPLTIILKKKKEIPDLVSAGLDTVGIRMPNNEITREIIRKSQTAIAAPSANLFGHTSPTSAKAVLDDLDGRIDAVIDGGNCKVGLESTIISFAKNTPVCYRYGGLDLEYIESIIGKVERAGFHGEEDVAPGRSLRHYAPNTPLYLDKKESDFPEGTKIGYINQDGDLYEIAKNLYSEIRNVDDKNCDVILAHLVEEKGIGMAINDRLRRAATTQPT
ncbi:MAG: L-threonylcarbamoyladenylate synthase [Chitinivibrionia bacterium]|nr:L-threonylcarbamoyladenylate synthase [Chitinivibrionia bacterium]